MKGMSVKQTHAEGTRESQAVTSQDPQQLHLQSRFWWPWGDRSQTAWEKPHSGVSSEVGLWLV